ncbi:hypothetical protein HMN09_00922600 [Mycena chlorophos]|uniref:Uncharacterized protein n=1 Tax=Mycena chlorophos TaxID=658473 RepID=A0A8H6W2B5_MYCCL|nr:hypothetical protein HMN09_00922600 [Mycena chlorophos]
MTTTITPRPRRNSTFPAPPTPRLPASVTSRTPHAAPPAIQRGRPGARTMHDAVVISVPAPRPTSQPPPMNPNPLLSFRPSTKDVLSGIAPHVFLDFDERRARSLPRRTRRRRRAPSPSTECCPPTDRRRSSPSPSPSRGGSPHRRIRSPLRRAWIGVDDQGVPVLDEVYTAASATTRRTSSPNARPPLPHALSASGVPTATKIVPAKPVHVRSTSAPVVPASSLAQLSKPKSRPALNSSHASKAAATPPTPSSHAAEIGLPHGTKKERFNLKPDGDVWKSAGFRLDKAIKTFVARHKA